MLCLMVPQTYTIGYKLKGEPCPLVLGSASNRTTLAAVVVIAATFSLGFLVKTDRDMALVINIREVFIPLLVLSNYLVQPPWLAMEEHNNIKHDDNVLC